MTPLRPTLDAGACLWTIASPSAGGITWWNAVIDGTLPEMSVVPTDTLLASGFEEEVVMFSIEFCRCGRSRIVEDVDFGCVWTKTS